jgi:acetyl esterase/lipase
VNDPLSAVHSAPAVALALLGTVGALFVINAFRPVRRPAAPALFSFFAGWLTTELAVQHLVVHALLAAVLVALGALQSWPGMLGLVLSAGTCLGLWTLHRGALATHEAVRRGLEEALGPALAASGEARPAGEGEAGRDLDAELEAAAAAVAGPPALAAPPDVGWRELALPIPPRRDDVEVERDVVFHQEGRLRLRLDVYRGRGRPAGGPAFVFVHGGAWVMGDKSNHGLPVVQYLAAQGWTCFTVNYRLSPRATFPDHLIDVKRALAYVRQHGEKHGADPSFLVISGGSAGGHLSSLAALTPNQAQYQPGFEEVDTRVDACVPFYGIYDLTDRFGHWPNPGLRRLFERRVLKRPFDEAREAYEQGSPLSWVSEEAPPFLLIHGDKDSLVPVEESRRLSAALRERSQRPVGYIEVPGAQHAFEVFLSPRSLLALEGMSRFMTHLYDQHRQGRRRQQRAA